MTFFHHLSNRLSLVFINFHVMKLHDLFWYLAHCSTTELPWPMLVSSPLLYHWGTLTYFGIQPIALPLSYSDLYWYPAHCSTTELIWPILVSSPLFYHWATLTYFGNQPIALPLSYSDLFWYPAHCSTTELLWPILVSSPLRYHWATLTYFGVVDTDVVWVVHRHLLQHLVHWGEDAKITIYNYFTGKLK